MTRATPPIPDAVAAVIIAAIQARAPYVLPEDATDAAHAALLALAADGWHITPRPTG